jgi:hypothetical protein
MIIFIYLNLITIRFEDKEKIKRCTKFNPNLVKIFLRYYPELAEEFGYDLGSDKEDYEFSQKELMKVFSEEKGLNNHDTQVEFVA